MELLVYLMNEIQDERQPGEIDLADLRDRGYTQAEISTAFSWLHDHVAGRSVAARTAESAAAGSRRHLHDAEKMMLSVEAQGYLIHLRELGLVSDRDVETVLERVMLSGYERLGVGDLQALVASVILPRADGATGPMLNSGDSVH